MRHSRGTARQRSSSTSRSSSSNASSRSTTGNPNRSSPGAGALGTAPAAGPVIGIDVAKASLEVAFSSAGPNAQYANSKAGIQKLVTRLTKLAPRRVVLEPTGGYETALLIALLEAGLPAVRVDARRARAFNDARGQRAKTDKIDAMMLAEFGETLPTAALTAPDKRLLKIRAYVDRRDQLVELVTKSLGHLDTTCASLKQEIKSLIGIFKKRIERIEKQIDILIGNCPEISERYERLRSVPSIGPVVGAKLLTHCPELGTLNRREAAAIVGLAPHPKQSGKLLMRPHISGGRPSVRRALYMASLSAIQGKSPLRTFYDHLVSKGKAKKQAICAVARKLVVIANAVLRDAVRWTDQAPIRAK